MRLLIASKNNGKIVEIKKCLELPELMLLDYKDFGDWPEPAEIGETLEENAIIKAVTIHSQFGLPTLADDSGLLVDYLNGRPGIKSSRYAGPEGDAERNMDLLLSEMKGVPSSRRSARFCCTMALALPSREVKTTTGECEGTIICKKRGNGGFGYDPIFKPAGYDCSMAELSVEAKNVISHRGKALRAMKKVIEKLISRDSDL
ncbi:MAG: RdgB/HAM1 family non-canonical purine NTP pyrophosphatase [Actinobacteria bacterium]|nr:RdgB/HAM1 family non-canonical purine NTP pyrophosphatase [Actinomycetota bacterium]